MADILRIRKIFMFIKSMKTNVSFMSISLLTYDIAILLKSANFKIIIIETIGIGQTDNDIYSIADIICLIIQPIEGDSLQTFKKGILELVDIILINKCDTTTILLSKKMRHIYINCLQLNNVRYVITISGLQKVGIKKMWMVIKQVYTKKIKKYKIFYHLLKKILSVFLMQIFLRLYKNKIWYKREENLLIQHKKSISQIIFNFIYLTKNII